MRLFHQLLVACLIAHGWAAAGPIDFARDVQPLLEARCGECHGPKKEKAHLRLDAAESIARGSENGLVVVPGRPDASSLWQRITSADADEMMPPKGERLSAAETKVLRDWIAAGAPELAEAQAAKDEERAAGHWAFQPPTRPALPEIQNQKSEIGNAIDAVLLAKQRELGLTPSPEADRRTLIRRVTLDLTGLPPTPEEVEAFLDQSATTHSADSSYEQLVDKLLASPAYGERWGRFWLDLARWAESDGYEANDLRASAWRYRDYVVKAFNDDLPYDRFLREQIAGDELSPFSDAHLVATGFLAAGRVNNNEEDKVVQLNESIVDIANATASVTLGLTMSCAQCHDHKFEALTIRDYYAWHGFFVRGQVNSLVLKDAALVAQWGKSHPPELDTARKLLAQLTDPVRAKLRAEALEVSDEALKKPLSDDDQKLLAELKKKIATLERKLADSRPQAWGFYSPATSPHTVENLPPRGQYPFLYKPAALKDAKPAVLKRGSVALRGETVESAVPAVLGGAKFSTRRELADWLASDANPLTARVWVNFVWQQHFGRGLVETPGDFGVKGARPANQALLDWLACELREHGWSTKRLHRLIVTSAAYRRASRSNEANEKLDPYNRHLWRWLPRRLEAEAIRDLMLVMAGQLDLTAGGPSDPPDKSSRRRSLYQLQPRFQLPPGQALFDAPAANESCPRRHISTVPLQPLLLLNNEANVKLAADFAARVRHVAGDNRERQLATAFHLALGREPDGVELAESEKFLAREPAALADFCQAVLNLNEFVYLP